MVRMRHFVISWCHSNMWAPHFLGLSSMSSLFCRMTLWHYFVIWLFAFIDMSSRHNMWWPHLFISICPLHCLIRLFLVLMNAFCSFFNCIPFHCQAWPNASCQWTNFFTWPGTWPQQVKVYDLILWLVALIHAWLIGCSQTWVGGRLHTNLDCKMWPKNHGETCPFLTQEYLQWSAVNLLMVLNLLQYVTYNRV